MKQAVNQTFWDNSYKSIDVNNVFTPSLLINWLTFQLKKISPQKNCLEVGCFPGGFLRFFSRNGYVVSGIDLTPRVTELPLAFKKDRIEFDNIYYDNFFTFDNNKKYGIVCSFGFIEHFLDWKNVLLRMDKFVAPDGYLIVCCPNFSGFFQRMIHFLLDYENYKLHEVKSMDPIKWKNYLIKIGYTDVYSGHIGGFDYWLGCGVKGLKAIIHKELSKYKQKTQNLKPHHSYSPFAVLIMKKNENTSSR